MLLATRVGKNIGL